MAISPISWPRGYPPTAAEWMAAVNQLYNFLQQGIPSSYMQLDNGGRLPLSISGDAQTVGGFTALELLGGELPDLMQVMGVFFVPSSGLVLRGGVASADPIVLDRVAITPITALVKAASTGFVTLVQLPASSVFTIEPTSTYYLDLVPGAVDYSWGLAHPVGDYTPIAEVTTDGAGQVAGVFDRRIMQAEMLQGYDAQLTFPSGWLGNSTVDDTQAPGVDAAPIGTLLSNLANRIKAITGAALWRSAPATTIQSLNTVVGGHATDIGGLQTTVGTLQTNVQAARIRSFLGV